MLVTKREPPRCPVASALPTTDSSQESVSVLSEEGPRVLWIRF